jgi:hypothetical protein
VRFGADKSINHKKGIILNYVSVTVMISTNKHVKFPGIQIISAGKSTFAKQILENVHDECERTDKILNTLKVIPKGFMLNVYE